MEYRNKYFKGILLLIKAYNSTKHQIWTSIILLTLATTIFTILMWIAESRANPDFGWLDALIWTVVKYVEDPAGVTESPATIFGQIVGTLVGILGIAIFAVPAGLIGSGLLDAMEELKEKDITLKNSKLLHKQFRRIPQSASWIYNENNKKITFKGVPRYRSLAHIQVKTGMTNDEVITSVNNCPDMRLMNLATTQREEERPQDRLVVVNFPLNNEYGCFIDRGSDVTIVAPVAITEPGTGSFAFSLAAMGEFNYVSKELKPNSDEPFGFYTMQKSKLALIDDYNIKEDVESQALHFMDDLKKLKQNSQKKGKRHWFIFILATSKSVDCQVHFWRLATDNKKQLSQVAVNDLEYGSTIMKEDEDTLQSIFHKTKEALEAREVTVKDKNQPISVCLDNNDILKSVGPSNIMCRMGGGNDCNTLTIRFGYEILLYHSSHLLIAKDLADAIKDQIEPDKPISAESKKCFLKEGEGYADDYCKTDVFEQDSEILKKMIAQGRKKARINFEIFDLDGNIENHKPEKHSWRKLLN